MGKEIIIMALLLLPTIALAQYSDCTIYGICQSDNVTIYNNYSSGGGGGNFSGLFTDLNFSGTTGFDDFVDNVSAGGGGFGDIFVNETGDTMTGDLTINAGFTQNGSAGGRFSVDTFVDPESGTSYDLKLGGSTGGLASVGRIRTLDNLTVDKYANITYYVTPTGEIYYYYGLNDDIILDVSSIGGANYFEIATAGAFVDLWANPNVANGYKLFTITETQGDDTNMNFYEGGTTHNRFWSSGSVRIGGDESYLCTNLTDWVDCNTASTGADLIVQDELAVLGKIFTSDWTNVTITESQISDLQSYLTSESDPLWSANLTAHNDTWTSTYNATYDAYNSTGLIKDWNNSGYIKDWNASGLIINWSTSEAETDPLWTGNKSSVAFLAEDETITGEYTFNNNIQIDEKVIVQDVPIAGARLWNVTTLNGAINVGYFGVTSTYFEFVPQFLPVIIGDSGLGFFFADNTGNVEMITTTLGEFKFGSTVKAFFNTTGWYSNSTHYFNEEAHFFDLTDHNNNNITDVDCITFNGGGSICGA